MSQTNFGFFFQNAYNAKGDYGRCIADAAGLFNGYLLYDLPFGKGRMFGSGVAPVVNAIIGGWSMASNFTLHTGFALYPHAPDASGTNSASPRPNCVAGVTATRSWLRMLVILSKALSLASSSASGIKMSGE